MLSNFTWPVTVGGIMTVGKLLPAIVVLLLCLIAIKVLMRLFSRALTKSKIDKTLQPFLRSAVHILLYLFTVLIVADQLGIPVTSLIAALSVAGLAVSLAIQGALSNIAGGIMILLTKPFVVGDYVEAGDVGGTVEEIGLSYTRLMTVDNRAVYVPNSDVSTAKITNYTAAPTRRMEIKVTASYDAPTESVKKALFAAAARHPEVCGDPAPFANLSDYKDSCIEYLLRVWVPTADYWTVYFALLEDIREEFQKADVEMSYPHMNVHMLQ